MESKCYLSLPRRPNLQLWRGPKGEGKWRSTLARSSIRSTPKLFYASKLFLWHFTFWRNLMLPLQKFLKCLWHTLPIGRETQTQVIKFVETVWEPAVLSRNGRTWKPQCIPKIYFIVNILTKSGKVCLRSYGFVRQIYSTKYQNIKSQTLLMKSTDK